MKILLTGSSGQVGHALQTHLAGLGDIIAPQRAQLDLSNRANITDFVQATRPDLIINPAAYTAVDLAEDEVTLAHTINAEAVKVFAEQALQLNIPLIHYSTDYVFDGEKRNDQAQLTPYVEDDQCAPIGAYGASKRAGEMAIIESDCRHLILRTSWVYSDFGKNFMLTMLRLGADRDQLKVVNDQWGAPTSALWIAEVTAQIVRQFQNTIDPDAWWLQHQGIVHLTPANSTNWQGFAQAIFDQALELELIAKKPEVQGIPSAEYPTRAKRPHNSMLSTDRLKNVFGIDVPQWEDCLNACLQRLKSQQIVKELA
jgi:dTDP-4-dehydrorhamnose reductase